MTDKFTRYDILVTPQKITIRKWRDWTPGVFTVNDDYEEKPADYDLDQALTWFEQHGYTVRRWPGGARIWLGKPVAVRTASEIKAMRSRLTHEAESYGGVHPRFQVHTLDLALDL